MKQLYTLLKKLHEEYTRDIYQNRGKKKANVFVLKSLTKVREEGER